jgi:TPR repeat protein
VAAPLVLCLLLAAGSVAGQQVGEDVADVDSAKVHGPLDLSLRAGATTDATEELMDEIYPLRGAVIDALVGGIDEEALIASIQDPENENAAAALCQLGNLCATQGHEDDALKCYQAAAERFDMGGMYNYANALLRGRGCDKNEAAATAWFREVATMVCDSTGFIQRHLPRRILVSEPGEEETEELLIEYDDKREFVKHIESAKSGQVLWHDPDGSQPAELLEDLFKNLDVQWKDEDSKGSVLPNFAPPSPLWAGFKEAVIDVGKMVSDSLEPMAANMDFEEGTVEVRNGDGSQRQLTAKETLAAMLLTLSLNRGKADSDEEYTETLLKSEGWLAGLDVLQKGAAGGDADMCAVLGALSDVGLGVPHDPDKAHELMLVAAKKGVPEAMTNVGLHLVRKEQDALEAGAKVPGKRYPVAPSLVAPLWKYLPLQVRSLLAMVCRSGAVSEGRMWLHKAADAGCGAGAYNLAVALQEDGPDLSRPHGINGVGGRGGGGGVEGRRQLGRCKVIADLYFQAAKKGHGAAMNNLALMYLFGSHPEGRNLVQARKWLRKAAEEPSGVFLATDKFAKELFDGSEFEEEDPDRDLSEVPNFFLTRACLVRCVCAGIRWVRRRTGGRGGGGGGGAGRGGGGHTQRGRERWSDRHADRERAHTQNATWQLTLEAITPAAGAREEPS